MFFAKTPEKEEQKILNVYKNVSENGFTSYYASQTSRESSDEKVGQYICDDHNCKDYYATSNNVLIYDKEYIVYNYIKNLKTKVSLGNSNYSSVELVEFDNQAYGLIVRKNDESAYYSLKENKYTTDFVYDIISSDKEMINKGYALASAYNEEKASFYVLNVSDGKVLLSSNTIIESINNGSNVYFLVLTAESNSQIYNSNFELLFDGKSYNQYAVASNGSIVVANAKDTYYTKYDAVKKSYVNSKKYKSVNLILEDQVIVTDSKGYLTIVDFEDKIISKVVKMTNKLVFNSNHSYKNEEGIHLFVVTGNTENKLGICDKYLYNFSTKLVTKEYFGECGVY
jgi:hypothetical protein